MVDQGNTLNAIIDAPQNKGYMPRRIRSQITWESEEQKEFFQKVAVESGFDTMTDYCRDIANQRIEWRAVHDGWDILWKEE